MNHERLGAILECMESALLSPEKLQMYGVTRDEVREAFKWLEGLVERDTPKRCDDWNGQDCHWCSCPNCGGLVTNQHDYCNCGQQLDWSE